MVFIIFLFIYFFIFLNKNVYLSRKVSNISKTSNELLQGKRVRQKYDTKIKIECEDNEGSYFDVTVNSALWSPQRTCI